jgi:cobalamin synthase
MGFEMWFLIVIGAAVAVILGSVFWIARGDGAGKPDVADTAMGLGIATSGTHHPHGPADSGGAGAGSAGGDGGSSAP